MLGKILVLVGSNNSANGVCAKELCTQLVNIGYDVHCVCYDDNFKYDNYINKEIKYHTVKRTFRYKIKDKYIKSNKILYLVLLKFISFINLFNYPFSDYFLNRRYYKVALNLQKEIGFNIIISIYNPIEALYTGAKIKKKFNDVFTVFYTLDTMTNAYRNKSILNKYKFLKNKIYERKLYLIYDMIINMECHRLHYEGEEYNDFSYKMFISDIPLLNCNHDYNYNKILSSEYIDKSRINYTYAGTLDFKRRNPTYICNIFLKLNKIMNNSCLNFFGGGDCQEIIKNFEKKSNSSIILHGMVSHDEVLRALYDSDVLISLEAKNSDMVSAKIFEYISLNKKIIHFYSSDSDVMLKYLKKYNNCLLIFENNSFEDNIKLIVNFTNKKLNENHDLNKIFYENTADYVCNLILNKNKEFIKIKKGSLK